MIQLVNLIHVCTFETIDYEKVVVWHLLSLSLSLSLIQIKEFAGLINTDFPMLSLTYIQSMYACMYTYILKIFIFYKSMHDEEI